MLDICQSQHNCLPVVQPLCGPQARTLVTRLAPPPCPLPQFVSGVLGARFSPSVLLAGGLMATALINIAFGFGTSLTW